MSRPNGESTLRNVLDVTRVRRTGFAFRLGAGFWVIHCGLVIVLGAIVIALRNGVPMDSPSLLYVIPLAISTASAGTIALGVGLRSASLLSADFVDPRSDVNGAASDDEPTWPTAARSGKTAGHLCFVFAGIGFATLGYVLFGVGSNELSGSITLSSLWLLAFAVLAVAGVFGADPLEPLAARLGIHDDPFHLFRWYAGLTALFSNWFLLALFLFSWGGVLLAIPFGLIPLVGIESFRRIFHFGALLVQTNPRLPATRLASVTSAEGLQGRHTFK